MGHRLQYVVAIGEEVVRVWSQSRFEPGAEVWVSVGPEQVLVRSDDQR
jgi:hypothetical protein